MWIRSQDKRSLTKVVNISLDIPLSSGEVGIKGYFDNNKFDMLGYYRNEKRAIEVLDEIQKKIIDFEFGKANECLISNEVVYQMPKE